jgi:hypothetical protein
MSEKPKKKIQFGEEKRDGKEVCEAKKAINARSGCPNEIRLESMVQSRYVSPEDFDRWEQQRLERKRKRHTLDPYR